MIKEFFRKIRDGFYNWCDRAGDWFVGKHDVPVVGGILLWFGDKLKKSYKYYKDMKDTDATEFFVEDNGDISFDGDPIDVSDADDDAEFEEDEAPVEEKPEEETKKTPTIGAPNNAMAGMGGVIPTAPVNMGNVDTGAYADAAGDMPF